MFTSRKSVKATWFWLFLGVIRHLHKALQKSLRVIHGQPCCFLPSFLEYTPLHLQLDGPSTALGTDAIFTVLQSLRSDKSKLRKRDQNTGWSWVPARYNNFLLYLAGVVYLLLIGPKIISLTALMQSLARALNRKTLPLKLESEQAWMSVINKRSLITKSAE